jgi:hypothetical protein
MMMCVCDLVTHISGRAMSAINALAVAQKLMLTVCVRE